MAGGRPATQLPADESGPVTVGQFKHSTTVRPLSRSISFQSVITLFVPDPAAEVPASRDVVKDVDAGCRCPPGGRIRKRPVRA